MTLPPCVRVHPQVVDDLLDLTASSSVLGKPALNDLTSGLATAPVGAGSRAGGLQWGVIASGWRCRAGWQLLAPKGRSLPPGLHEEAAALA